MEHLVSATDLKGVHEIPADAVLGAVAAPGVRHATAALYASMPGPHRRCSASFWRSRLMRCADGDRVRR